METQVYLTPQGRLANPIGLTETTPSILSIRHSPINQTPEHLRLSSLCQVLALKAWLRIQVTS